MQLFYKITVFMIFYYTLPYESSYTYYGAASEKPKIVLVGCSNLKYNIDYTLLNKEFANYNIIGCPLSEPSGLFSLLYNLKHLKTKKEDLVIFCLPHSLYEADKFLPLRNYKKSKFSKVLLMDGLRTFPLASLKEMLLIKVSLLKDLSYRKTVSSTTISYKDSPEIHSDSLYQSCWVNPDERFFIKSSGFNKDYIENIIELIHKNLNSNILFRYPAIRENLFEIDKDRLSYLDDRLPFINTLEESIYPSSYWFNQWYHLNQCGRDLNSKKLIHEIQSFLQKNDN